jgi:hypothetical protein
VTSVGLVVCLDVKLDVSNGGGGGGVFFCFVGSWGRFCVRCYLKFRSFEVTAGGI